MSATNNKRNAIRCLLAGFMAVVTSGTQPALAADWTDANNATYTALRSINGGATAITTGGGWIVTDITPTCTDTVKMRFRLHDTWTQTLWCGRGDSTTSATFTGFVIDNVIRCDRNANAGAKGATKPGTANDCTVVANYDTCKFLVNDEVQGAMMASGNYDVGSTLMLFGSHTKGADLSDLIAAGDVGNRGSYDLYYFQLYSSAGALTHNLMPAARDSDGAVGLFDTVTSNFYAKAANSGDFTSETKTAVTGAPVKWTGLGGDNNMSNPANWEGGVAPVAEQDLDFTIATPLVPINADINATFGKVWIGDVEKTTFTGALTVNDVNIRSMLDVADGATVTLLNVVASATWTGAADNGEFYDPDNWTCLNEVGTAIAGGVPTYDTAITLGADVSIDSWTNVNFAGISGPIDLAGHSLAVQGTFFNGVAPASKNLIVNGTFEADVVTGTSLNVDPQGWSRNAPTVFLIRNNTSYLFNNNKTDNCCFVPFGMNISQTFTLPEDAVLTLSLNHINKNTTKGTYIRANGNVKIDDTTIVSWNDTGYGVKSKTATVSLSAGSHTIKISCTSGSGNAIDNVSLTYQPSARAVTDSTGGGELHIIVPEGETVNNADINLTGHLKLVKEGVGAFVSKRSTLSYDGGTEVIAGTLSTTEGTGTHRPFGALHSAITVHTGGTLLNTKTSGDFCNYSVAFDGGTLEAYMDGVLIEEHENLTVTVGAEGGSIDTAGKSVTIKEPLLAADGTSGGMRFMGGGNVTITNGNTYAGTTAVEIGTTLHIPTGEDFPGTFTIEVPAGATGESLSDGVYTPVAIDGEGEFQSSVLNGIGKPANVTVRLSTDNKAIICIYGNPPNAWIGGSSGSLSESANWSLGFVPTSGNCSIGNGTAANLTVGNVFSPNSITFQEDTATITISGADSISGISAITNLSDATCVFEVPVAFAGEILVSQKAVDWTMHAQSSIRFTGGVTGTTFAEGTARYLNGTYSLLTADRWVANTYSGNTRWGIQQGSSLTVPLATDTSELALGEGSADVVIAGGAFTAAVVRTTARLCCYNQGEYVVTNELVMTMPGADRHLAYRRSAGAFKFEKVTLGNTGANKWFYFANSGAYYQNKNIWIGAGGLNFAEGVSEATAYACGKESNDVTYVHPWHSDYTIGTKPGSTRDFVINKATHLGTTDENGVARTVTADGIFHGSAALYVEGAGRFVVNAVNTHSGAVTVNGTATLAVNAGKKVTTGALTVNAGATLEVAQSGTVTLAGNLTLASGACLGFNFTNTKNPPILAIADGKTVTVNGAVTAKISAGSVWPAAGEKVLTSCGGFDAEGVSVTLANDSPEWVKSLSVNSEGNIVIVVKPRGTKIILR